MKTTHIHILCCLLALAGPIYAQQAEISAPLADELPAGAIFYIGWAGQTEAMAESSLGQILASPEVAQLWALLMQASQEDVGNGTVVFDIIGLLATHEFAVGVYPLAEGPAPSFRLIANLGDDADAYIEALDGLFGMLMVERDPVAENQWAYETPDGPMTLVRDGGMVSMSFGALPAMGDGLAGDEQFGTALTRVSQGQGLQAFVYMDFVQLRDMLTTMLPADAPGAGEPGSASFNAFFFNQENIGQLWQVAGLDEATSVALAMRFDGQRMRLTGRLESPGPHTGLLKFYASLPLTNEDLEVIPDDASFAFAMNLSLSDILGEVETALTAMDMVWENGQFMAGYEESMSGFAEAMGFELGDLFDALGDTWIFSHAPSQGGLLTGCVLTVEVADEAALAEMIAKVEANVARTGLGIETMGVIRYAVMPTRPYQPRLVAPAWMVHEGRLYVALWPQVLQTVLASEITPITENESFQTALASISGEPISLTYVDTPELIRLSYGAILLGGTAAVGEASRTGLPVDQSFVPSLARLEQLLTPELSAVCVDEEGISYEFSGALPMVSLVANLNVAPLTGMMIPALAEARSQARIGATKANIKGLHLAIKMYEVECGRYPDRWEEVVGNGNIGVGSLTLPGGGAPEYVDGELIGYVPYQYMRPLVSSDDSEIVIWVESRKDFSGQVMYVNLAGEVHLVGHSEFTRLLRAQSQARVEAEE